MSDSLWPHESQHARPPCPSPTPGVHSDSCPSSQWCHPALKAHSTCLKLSGLLDVLDKCTVFMLHTVKLLSSSMLMIESYLPDHVLWLTWQHLREGQWCLKLALAHNYSLQERPALEYIILPTKSRFLKLHRWVSHMCIIGKLGLCFYLLSIWLANITV